MRKLVCVLLALLALPSVKPAWIGEEKEYAVITQFTLSFAISEAGEAQTEVMLTSSMPDTIIIHIRVERKIGILWQKVSGAEWNDKTENTFYSTVSHRAALEKEGTYRAVVTASLQTAGESQKKTIEAVYVQKETAPKPTFSPGDVNRDGLITAVDARRILRFAARLELYLPEEKTLADVDGDGNVTAADARLVLRIAAKLN